jgi:hypothetical protein
VEILGGAPQGDLEVVLRPALACVMALFGSAAAAGQTVSAPGPWVVDIRGATSSVPTDLSFYPAQDVAFVPSRGFGLDLGGHLYVLTLGPARVGIGATVVVIRSTATEAPPPDDVDDAGDMPSSRQLSLDLRTIAPQVSFNFGSRDGWSYLSAGVGVGSVTTRVETATVGERRSGQLRSINFGGGARWFLTPRMAIGFDVRAHRLAATGGESPTPRVSAVAVSAGLSLR